MWLGRLFLTSLLMLQAAPPQESLTEKQVGRAIARAEKETDPAVCVNRNGPEEFSVCFQGPEQRISLAASLAKQARGRLRPEDVSLDVKAKTWTVVVRPNRPGLVNGRPVHAPLAEEVMVQVRGRPEVSRRSLSTTRMPVSWDNAVGVELKGQGLTATLDPARLPPADLDVVVTAEGGEERRYVLSQVARARIR